MAAIRHAVVVVRPGDGPQIDHLYLYRSDAERCAEAYVAQLGLAAWAAELDPPLAVAGRPDVWAVAGAPAAGGGLRLYGTRDAARAASAGPAGGGPRPACAPIRGGMPVQRGVPRFAPAGGPDPAPA